MIRRIYNKHTNRKLREIAQEIYGKTIKDFNAPTEEPSLAKIEDEIGRYKVVSDYFGENNIQTNSEENRGYTQKIISRLVEIYAYLKEKRGLKEEHPLMRKCARTLEGVIIKSLPEI